MLMIPITFVPTTVLVAIAVWLATKLRPDLRAPWLIAFLCSLALQLLLLGVRYGYGMESILGVQHLSGVLIPPLAYLAFTNPPFSVRVLMHGLSVGVMGLVLFFVPYFADAVLGVITLGYAVGLAVVLWRNGDTVFAWAPLRYTMALRLGLYGAVATLVLSGTTDAIIAADFWIADGNRTSAIAAMASLGGLMLLVIYIVLFSRFNFAKPSMESSDADTALVQRISLEIVQKGLYRDPDLTISRLSKQLGLPARQISQAVNRSAGLNMSQFINNMRIRAVCEMLACAEVSVTTAMLDAGFYTKSNFNREFRRVMGQTPTEWRNALKSP